DVIGSTDTFDLAQGEDKTDVDAGVEDPAPQVGSLSGRYFVDENDNNQDDGEPGVAGVSVALLDAAGNPTGRTTTTDANGSYRFGDLAPGTYGVRFTDTVSGKVLIDPNVGPDETDSDAIDQGNGVSIIPDIDVVAGQDTPNNDAGVEEPPPQVGSLSGRYFVDENDNNQDDGEPGVANVSVALLDAAGNPTGRTTTTDANGSY
ncbi:SdrD B-like domain-containing protein, partial [Thiorhodococcus minor]